MRKRHASQYANFGSLLYFQPVTTLADAQLLTLYIILPYQLLPGHTPPQSAASPHKKEPYSATPTLYL